MDKIYSKFSTDDNYTFKEITPAMQKPLIRLICNQHYILEKKGDCSTTKSLFYPLSDGIQRAFGNPHQKFHKSIWLLFVCSHHFNGTELTY